MTYREYLQKSSFEEIFPRIIKIYGEAPEIEQLYHQLYDSVLALSRYETSEVMTIRHDSRGDILVDNSLDPQEELVDREVVFYMDPEDQAIPETDVAAHLLWWSSMYGFLTSEQKQMGFVQWLDEISRSIKASTTGEIIDGVSGFSEKRVMKVERWESESLTKKRLRYWRDTIISDCAYDWTWNLDILRKKIQYNIGYWKYVQRYDSNNRDIRHMKTACALLDLAAEHYRDLDGTYVNSHNALRFGESVDSEDDEMRDFALRSLRCAKAKNLVWRYIDRYIKDWWD